MITIDFISNCVHTSTFALSVGWLTRFFDAMIPVQQLLKFVPKFKHDNIYNTRICMHQNFIFYYCRIMFKCLRLDLFFSKCLV